ncbi:hypothetical protein BH09SUM1_BH09SUM1_14850 [soil metagenome]
MKANSLRRPRAFTFVEILVALAFMAIVIPITLQGISLASRVSSRGLQKRVAAELANSKLNELVVTGDWQGADESGDFGDDHPGFTWNVTSEDWTEDALTEVTVSVSYKVQGQEYSEALATVVRTDETDDGTGTTSQ